MQGHKAMRPGLSGRASQQEADGKQLSSGTLLERVGRGVKMDDFFWMMVPFQHTDPAFLERVDRIYLRMGFLFFFPLCL